MRVMFIGGTGFISTAVSKQAIEQGFDLFLLNRGQRSAPVPGSHSLTADMRNANDVRTILQDLHFDAVVDWIAFTPQDIERDLALFSGRTDQPTKNRRPATSSTSPRHCAIPTGTMREERSRAKTVSSGPIGKPASQ